MVGQALEEGLVVGRGGAVVGRLDVLADDLQGGVRLRADHGGQGQLRVRVFDAAADVQLLELFVELKEVVKLIVQAQRGDLGGAFGEVFFHAFEASTFHLVSQRANVFVRAERVGEADGGLADVGFVRMALRANDSEDVHQLFVALCILDFEQGGIVRDGGLLVDHCLVVDTLVPRLRQSEGEFEFRFVHSHNQLILFAMILHVEGVVQSCATHFGED